MPKIMAIRNHGAPRSVNQSLEQRLWRDTLRRHGCFRLALILCVAALSLTGCLPEYPIESMQFSPDGRYLGYYASDLGIKVADLEASRDFILLSGNIKGNSFDWSPDSRQIALCLDSGGSWDIWTVDFARETQQITFHPSKDFQPQWAKDSKGIYFVSDRNGDADIWRHDMGNAREYCIIARPDDQLSPRLSPDGRFMSYLSYERAKPELFLFDMKTSESWVVHGVGDIDASIAADSVSWSADSRKFVYTAREGNAHTLNLYDLKTKDRREIVQSTHPITSPVISPDGERIFCVEQGSIRRRGAGLSIPKSLYFDGFTQGIAVIHPQGKYLAFSVERSFVGICRPDFSERKFLSFRLEDEISLAHLYALQGRKAKAIRIYDDLLKSVQVDRHLATVKFYYALELYKLGEARRATRLLEELAESSRGKPDPQKVFSSLGYAYLFQGNREKARAAFEESIGGASQSDEHLPPALEILRSGNADLIERFTKASKLVFLGNYSSGIKEFRRLLRHYPDDPSVQAEYLAAQAEMEQTVFSVFPPDYRIQLVYKKLSADMLEYFVSTALSSPKIDELRNDLFWRYFELEDYASARSLLLKTFRSGKQDSLLPSVIEMLSSYVEPEVATDDIAAAINATFLDHRIRTYLLKPASGEHVRLLVHLALAKRYCLVREGSGAESELTEALRALEKAKTALAAQQISKYELALHLLKAKSLELKGLFQDAVTEYGETESLLKPMARDFPKTVWEVRFQREFLRNNLERPRFLQRVTELRTHLGDGLVAPYGDKTQILLAFKGFKELADQTRDLEARDQITYFSAMCYTRLQDTPMATLLFRRLLRNPGLPPFLQKKVKLELATAYDENDEDFLAKEYYSDLSRMGLDNDEMILLQAQH